MDYLASNFREEYLFTHLLYLFYQSIISDKESRVAVVAPRQQDCEAALYTRHWLKVGSSLELEVEIIFKYLFLVTCFF